VCLRLLLDKRLIKHEKTRTHDRGVHLHDAGAFDVCSLSQQERVRSETTASGRKYTRYRWVPGMFNYGHLTVQAYTVLRWVNSSLSLLSQLRFRLLYQDCATEAANETCIHAVYYYYLFILEVQYIEKKERKKTSDSAQKLNKRTCIGATTAFENQNISVQSYTNYVRPTSVY